MLEQGINGHWEKPWISAGEDGRLPYNAASNRPYEFANAVMLMFEAIERGFEYSGWMTFNQAKELNASIKKGAKSSVVIFRDYFGVDENGQRIPKSKIQDALNAGKEVNRKWYLKYYRVFNIEEINDLPESFYLKPDPVVLTPTEKDQRCEEFLHSTGAKIIYRKGDRAFYRLATDTITLPLPDQFKTTGGLYETAFHELGHWTGHPTRCDRPLDKAIFGDKDYAFEELIAELYACYTASFNGMSLNMTNNVAYLKSWLKAIQSNNKHIFSASSKAQFALNWTLHNIVRKSQTTQNYLSSIS